jgi:hypothetical protein
MRAKMENGESLVAQIGNLPYRRLAAGGRSQIANPRHGRLPVCVTHSRFEEDCVE